ncbi:MAG: HD domain-containing protein [Nitrosopumilus sp.]|nr:HD domain-containing protein [Nitrosopumilus sp.]
MKEIKKFNIQEISLFLDHFYKLKEIERAGWSSKLLLESPESVAEHTLTMLVIALLFAEYSKYSLPTTIKIIKMILLHDLGESIIGDYVPGAIDIEKKKRLENKAISKIISKIPWITIKKKYFRIWNEFNENKTDTSKLIHIIDKLEMAMQAKYYLKNNKNIKKNDVKPFFESALRYVIENYDTGDTKKIVDFDKKNDINEIEQILLYLYK